METGYKFKDKTLYETAMTHSSFTNEQRQRKAISNERLEFLGDSVLSLITSEYIYTSYAARPEGDLSRVRAAVVCEKSLSEFARILKLGDALSMGKGEDTSGGRERDSILADAFEALLGAIYLDGGLEEARGFLLPYITPAVRQAVKGKRFTDYKTELQEIVQRSKGEELQYKLKGERGPDHRKTFEVDVFLNSNLIGSGEGRTKKEAEQQAARAVLKLMGM
jgi:ribonuclease-3